jgi:signal transduction histidine kinase
VPRAEATPLDVVRISPAPRRSGADADLDAVAEAAIRAVRSAFRPEPASVRVSLPDDAGRLRLAVAVGDLTSSVPARSTRNRTAFHEQRAVRATLLRPRGFGVVAIPLCADGRSFGVLEVVARVDALDDGWSLLDAISSQASMSLRALRERAGRRAGEDALEALSAFATDLVRAESATEALRTVVAAWFERLGAPAAAWVLDGGAEPSVVAVRGVGSSKRAELGRRLVAQMSESPEASPAEIAGPVFAEVSGIDEVSAIDAGRAVVVVADHAVSGESVEFLRSFLIDVLQHLDAVAWARRRERELERSLAITAHELREPLFAVRAQMDGMLYQGGWDGEERDALRRARRELNGLVETADAVLRWSATGETPRMRRTDLASLVREVAATANEEAGFERVTVGAPQHAMVRAARVHLRMAVANVVRNAVAYSPPDSEVRCRIEQRDMAASLWVEDAGPGVPAAEARAIFDPFARGGSAHLARAGRGLGLYVARRIVQAQGGTIELEAREEGQGAAFRIDMPIAGRVRRGGPRGG